MPTKTSNCDVLIIGAGPAGLMAALWLAHLNVNFRIIDRRSTRALGGRADGLQFRTMEILDSFGLAETFKAGGYAFDTISTWTTARDGGIIREHQRPIGSEPTAARPLLTSQGHIEAYLIDAILRKSGCRVERSITPTDMVIDAEKASEQSAYPVSMTLQHLKPEEADKWHVNAHHLDEDGTITPRKGSANAPLTATDQECIVPTCSPEAGSEENLKCKYVIAGDGGHSWVRKQLGFTMDGASTNKVWGVMDILPITDFPDVRVFSTFLTPHGTMLLIPREGGLARFYIQYPDEPSTSTTRHDDRTSLEQRNFDKMFALAKRMIEPYKLDYRYCDWWTIYRSGQRISSGFFAPQENPRVFLAGDALHTHTPKEGQGLNVSTQDSYNLAWKIGGVVKSQLNPSVLSTYQEERRPIAEDLIDLDKAFSAALSSGKTNIDEEFRALTQRMLKVTTGLYVTYQPNALIVDNGRNGVEAAPGIPLGVKLQCVSVYNQFNLNKIETLSLLPSDGRWRILVFAGKALEAAQLKRVETCGKQLLTLQKRIPRVSLISPYAGFDSIERSLLQVLLVHEHAAMELEAGMFGPPFFAQYPDTGYEYDSIFADPDGNTHREYEVGELGAMVLCRPDQFVCWKGGLDDTEGLKRYFESVLNLSP